MVLRLCIIAQSFYSKVRNIFTYTHFFAWPSMSWDQEDVVSVSSFPEALEGSFSFVPAEIMDSNISLKFAKISFLILTLSLSATQIYMVENKCWFSQINVFHPNFPSRFHVFYFAWRFFLIPMLRWILRCCVGNDSASKVDEPALGQWVRVVRKSMNNRNDLFKKTFLTEATKKTFFRTDPRSLSQCHYLLYTLFDYNPNFRGRGMRLVLPDQRLSSEFSKSVSCFLFCLPFWYRPLTQIRIVLLLGWQINIPSLKLFPNRVSIELSQIVFFS